MSALSPTADLLAFATADRDVVILDLRRKVLALRTAAQPADIANVVWSPDGTTLAIGLRDGSVVLTESKTGLPRRTLSSKRVKTKWWGEDGKLSFFADGTILATALGDNHIDLWNVNDGTRRAQLNVQAGHSITAMCADRVAGRLAAGTYEGEVRVWDIGDHAGPVRTMQVPSIYKSRYIHALDFDPSGQLLAIGSYDCRARIWTIDSDLPLREFDHCDYDWGRDAGMGAVRFSPDGTLLLTTPCDSIYDLSIWNVQSASRVSIYTDYGCGDEMPIACWFSPNGSRVISSFGLVTGTRQTDGSFKFAGPLKAEWQAKFCYDRDYAWAVVDHHLVVRKIPDERPILKIPVRES